ncbi:hypothetical protein GIB67_017407 [Kingdonia uniflora]|uniref:Uncharacterized protein n=1 Tax=Kingdonia uniflora TaxID=39325 RepID=A0A7J7M4G9_9MAGN|nr:hypothetical protein GIB67_017407 [Kingdonia uniflora]
MDRETEEKKRKSFARVCVEVEANEELPKVIPLFVDDVIPIEVYEEYNWIPVQCRECKVFGHSRLSATTFLRRKKGTQTLGMYYARLRSSWEELSHYDSFIEWPASAPSENVPILPTTAAIYAKIVEKARVFQFLAGLNPDFEYARVHLVNMTPFPTLEEAHAYCLFDQSRRSLMPPISGIPSETSAMAVRYAYPAPPSVPSQTSHTSSPSLSLLPAASDNSRPSRKKCDYCGK